MDTVSQPATVLNITKNALNGYVMRDMCATRTISVYPLRTMNLATDAEILATLSNLVYLFLGAEFARQPAKFFYQLVLCNKPSPLAGRRGERKRRKASPRDCRLRLPPIAYGSWELGTHC